MHYVKCITWLQVCSTCHILMKNQHSLHFAMRWKINVFSVKEKTSVYFLSYTQSSFVLINPESAKIKIKNWSIEIEDTSQLNSPAAAFCSRICRFSVFFMESFIPSSPAKLFKKLIVSDRPCVSPWRISKSSSDLRNEKKIQVKATKSLEQAKKKSTYRSVCEILSFICTFGEPAPSPSSFSAFAYQSGIQRSLPGILCSWYPRTIASRSLLAPLSYLTMSKSES